MFSSEFKSFRNPSILLLAKSHRIVRSPLECEPREPYRVDISLPSTPTESWPNLSFLKIFLDETASVTGISFATLAVSCGRHLTQL